MEKILEPLKNFSNYFDSLELMKDFAPFVRVECYAVGGSVRDSVIGTDVKDIDMALCFNFLFDFEPLEVNPLVSKETMKAQFLEAKEKKILELLSSDKYSFLHDKLTENFSAMSGLSHILQHCLKTSTYEVKKAFDNYKKNPEIINANASELFKEPPKLRETAYFNMGLSAVIMIEDKKSVYPVELLLTANNVESFVDDFDFNLCKAYMGIDGGVHTMASFDTDRENKTLTYCPNSYITEKKIERSLVHRLGRFALKFPDYSLELEDTKIKEHPLLEQVRENIKKLQCYHTLSRLTDVPKTETRKTNKI